MPQYIEAGYKGYRAQCCSSTPGDECYTPQPPESKLEFEIELELPDTRDVFNISSMYLNYTLSHAAGFMYTLSKRLRIADESNEGTNQQPSQTLPHERNTRDSRGQSPPPRRPTGNRGPAVESRGPRTFFKDTRDRSPPRDNHMGRPNAPPQDYREPPRQIHPDAARTIDRLIYEGRLKPGDLNDRCLAVLAETPVPVQVCRVYWTLNLVTHSCVRGCW